MENTKEYICRAVVTVVDHLGSVSANLECQLSQTDAFSDTELRIDSLNQVIVFLHPKGIFFFSSFCNFSSFL